MQRKRIVRTTILIETEVSPEDAFVDEKLRHALMRLAWDERAFQRLYDERAFEWPDGKCTVRAASLAFYYEPDGSLYKVVRPRERNVFTTHGPFDNPQEALRQSTIAEEL